MIIVSACLAGVECRYDGHAKTSLKITELVRQSNAIVVCPEQLGGLSTPRLPAEKKNGKMINIQGEDVTVNFERGVEEAMRLVQLYGATKAILKSNSPMCGCSKIYDGTFSNTLTDGDGEFCKALKKAGIEVETEEKYRDL